MSKAIRYIFIVLAAVAVCATAFLLAFPCPYQEQIERSALPHSLIYSIIKAESNFQEKAVSKAGAIGLMQIMPSTAQFICEREGIEFSMEKLKEGEYNITVGCAYLHYLISRFQNEETAVAAYNAGEGVVAEWLKNEEYSADGIALNAIPYPETRAYVKKIKIFRKIYHFLRDKT